MKGSASYDNASNSGNKWPLDDFFAALRRGGIGVTPAQMAEANKLLLQYAPLVPNEAALCQYLCPLFATNQAEQERFKEIFAAQFSHDQAPLSLTVPAPLPQRTWRKYLLALVPILLLVGWFIWKNQIDKKAKLSYALSLKSPNTDGSSNDDGFYQFVAGDTIRAALKPLSNDTAMPQIVKAKYNWGDNTALDSSGSHVYKTTGIYKLQVLVETVFHNGSDQKDTLEAVVQVCIFNTGISINVPGGGDSVIKGKPLMLEVKITSSNSPDSIRWIIPNGESEDRVFGEEKKNNTKDVKLVLLPFDTTMAYPSGKQQLWIPAEEGLFTVYATAIIDSLNGPCSVSATKEVYVYDPNSPQAAAFLQTAPNAKPLKPQYKVKPYWFWLFGGGIVLFMLLSSLFQKLYRRLQRAKQAAPLTDMDYQAWLASFASTQPPADIPFLNKNQLAPPEQEMLNIGRLMRRRIEGEAMYLHIGKTIAKAVRNSGFFWPILIPRTQQGEYLMLIAESHINSQQTKLFDYLGDTLRRYNVFVEKYYYRYEPSLCYSSAAPNGISLDKLSEKYPNHVLVIAGHGRQLVYPYQPIVRSDYQNILSRWKHKAILTPLPYADWGLPEKSILPTVLPVFPADVAGQLLMMQTMADSRIDLLQGLQEQAANGYTAAELDAEDIAELADYCQLAEWARSKDGDPYQNLLFQWIAALAVYPKLQWELTLAIGKAILDAAGQGHQLHYTNLLRMVRLRWMLEGIMPPELRLELLKKLSRPNEILARETILATLREIPANDLKPGHAAYEEKETQRIINEFNLFAYDPDKYASYARSKTFFERLWMDKKVAEAAVKKYLRNEQGQWATLINSPLAENPAGAESMPIETYFKPLPPVEKWLAKLYKSLGLLCITLIGVCALGLIGMLVLAFTNTNKFPLFTSPKNELHNVLLQVKDSTTYGLAKYDADKKVKEVAISVGDSSVTFMQSGNLLLPLSDTIWPVSIAVNGKPAFDTFMAFDRDRYVVVIKDKGKEEQEPIRVVFNLGPNCGDNFETLNRYRQIAESATMGIKVIMGPASGQANKAGTCINSIQVGKNVDTLLVQKIIDRFRQDSIYLTRKPATDYGIPDDEVFITSVAEEQPTPTTPNNNPVPDAKPLVYIQVSNASMLDSAEAFRKILISKGYQVNPAEVVGWNYNSEIYYFDKVVASEAQAIQRLYRSYYPKLAVQAKLRATNDKRPNDNRIVVWMQKLSGSTDPYTKGNTNQGGNEANTNQGGDNIGKRIVSIAQKEIGTGETPTGSGITKYGDWFDAKRNATGIKAWTGIFVSWVYNQAEVPLYIEAGEKGFYSVSNALRYFNDNKLITDNPVPGDIIVVVQKVGYQAGIFVKWVNKEKGVFETIEGNINSGTGATNVVAKGVRSTKTQKVYFVHINTMAQAASE